MWISDKIQHTCSSKYPVSRFLCSWSQPQIFSGFLGTSPSNSLYCTDRAQAGHFLLKPPSFQGSSSWTCFPGTHTYASHLRSSFVSLNVLQAPEAQGARPLTHSIGNTFDRARRGIFFRQMHACYFSWESRCHTTLQSSSPCTKSEKDASWIQALHLSLAAPSLPWSAYVWSYKRLSIFMS